MKTLADIYKFYVTEERGTLSKNDFKNICQDFNIHIMNHIIYEAGRLDMGNNLSTLEIIRLDRDYKKKRVDWKESNEYKKELLAKGEKLYDNETGEGTKWLIYKVDPVYCRFYWKRGACKVKNRLIYKLVMTRGENGNKTKLKNHLYENDINYLKYRKKY